MSAQRLIAGLVGKAPVQVRIAEFCIGSRMVSCDLGARPYTGDP